MVKSRGKGANRSANVCYVVKCCCWVLTWSTVSRNVAANKAVNTLLKPAAQQQATQDAALGIRDNGTQSHRDAADMDWPEEHVF